MQRCRKCQPVPEEVRDAADLLERRWQIAILFAAISGAVRFGEFSAAIEGISPRMLAARLRELEEAGVVERRVLPSSPPTVEYTLTARGQALAPVVEAVRAYAATAEHRPEPGAVEPR